GTDPLSQAVNDISAKKNVLFVIAAGNSGQGVGKGRLVSAPGAADAALTVGAIDKNRQLAAFSSRGPRYGDYALKPDIVAPGVQIMAARANGKAGNWYVAYSGTSMATPVTAGAAALVWQMHPAWTAAEVKDALMNAAVPIGAQCTSGCDGFVGAYDQGAGLVSLADNVQQAALIEPAGISFGSLKAKEKEERRVIVRNVSGATLHLTLGGTMHGPSGDAQAGLTISVSKLTLAPGETAPITLMITGPAIKGSYTGEVALSHDDGGARVGRATFAFVVR
ncbi:MAG: S8 family serine peptidase, partial [Chloroflexota bacterium]